MIDILANENVYQEIASGTDPHRIARNWQDQLQVFETMRAKYLIYK
jgi:uncharacterized protein YbbC (DUF1343 family)